MHSPCVASLLIASVAAAAAPRGTPRALSPRNALGLELGRSSLAEVVSKLGPPRALYLEGEDGEAPNPQPDDDLVLRYSLELAFSGHTHVCEVAVVIDNESYRVGSILINLVDPVSTKPLLIPVADIARTMAVEPEVLRVRPIAEATRSDAYLCIDPTGDYEVWLFPSRALEIIFEGVGEKAVPRALRYEKRLFQGAAAYSPCPH